MSRKPVVLRAVAEQDIAAALDHFRDVGGSDLALGLVDALEAAMKAIGARPATGSPRFAHELDLPGLRHRSLRRFRQLIFYVERADHIDVWRVLDARRDIPAWLDEGGE